MAENILPDRIDTLNKFLKSNFFGIDKVIDSVTEMIKPWYVLPDSMMRPLVINLWGMTGVGKTVLVRELAKFLGIKIIQIDLGDYVGTKEKNLGNHFYDKYDDLSGNPCIILIDEIHIARTKDPHGEEIDRQGIRGLWSLLSDGVIHVDSNYFESSIAWLDYQIEKVVDDFIIAKNSIGKKSKKNNEVEDWDIKQAVKYVKSPHRIFSENIDLSGIVKAFKYPSIKALLVDLDKDFFATCTLLREKLSKINLQPKLDFTKSLIFVTGNLDKLYSGSEDFDPDVDVELLKERNKDLTVFDVKENLFERFRLEQISRLGNNHIIYPVLDKKAYYSIIEKDLIRIKDFYEKNNIRLNFDVSVLDIIYKEGVFPNQGARSVLSTVGSFIEPVILKFYYLFRELKALKGYEGFVNCFYNEFSKNFIFKFAENQIEVKASLTLDLFRIPVINQKSAVLAIHEAGHIVACVLRTGVVPNKASIFKTSGNGTVEFSVASSKEEVDTFDKTLSYIIGTLSGQMAEKIVFGDKNISMGSYDDLSKATKQALDLVQSCGYEEAVSLERADSELSEKLFRTQEDENKARKILSRCQNESKALISKNLFFLKDLADCLLSSPSISKANIEAVMKEHFITCAKKFDYINKYKMFKAKNR